MRFLQCELAPVLLVALGLACSSKSSPHSDGGKVSDAGAIDSGSALDARRLDARGIDALTSEAGALRDAKDSGIDATSRDTKDTRGTDALAIDVAGVGDGSRDSTATKRDASPDVSQDIADDVVETPDLPVDTAPPPGTCANPIEIPYYVSHSDLAVDTTGAEHALDFPCAANGADIVFRVQTNYRELAYAHTFGTTWNTALYFTEDCAVPTTPVGEGMSACNDDACGTTQSQAVAMLGYGVHYLIVSGAGGESGPLNLHFEHSPIGNGPLVALPPGPATVVGTTDGIDSTRTCDTSGPKNSYWWVACPTALGGRFYGSTCNGADWDTSLILQVPRVDTVSCADDDSACGMQSSIDTTIPPGAGISVVSVAGNLLRSYGNYTMTYLRP